MRSVHVHPLVGRARPPRAPFIRSVVLTLAIDPRVHAASSVSAILPIHIRQAGQSQLQCVGAIAAVSLCLQREIQLV